MKLFEKYKLKIMEINGSINVSTIDKQTRILSHFLDYWNKTKDIKEDLLPELNLVIEGSQFKNDIGADVVGLAIVDTNSTLICMSELDFSDMELPTKDFQGLVLEWLNFLESKGK